MSQREAKEHPLSFLVVSRLSGVTILANSLNNPMTQSSSGGLRRGITVAIVGSGFGFLLAFTGLTTIPREPMAATCLSPQLARPAK